MTSRTLPDSPTPACRALTAALYCTLALRPARDRVKITVSRANSAEDGNRPCRTRSECGESCQLVPSCARKCPGVPRVGGCGVALAPRLCHVVPGRATL